MYAINVIVAVVNVYLKKLKFNKLFQDHHYIKILFLIIIIKNLKKYLVNLNGILIKRILNILYWVLQCRMIILLLFKIKIKIIIKLLPIYNKDQILFINLHNHLINSIIQNIISHGSLPQCLILINFFKLKGQNKLLKANINIILNNKNKILLEQKDLHTQII